ncbi:MAG: ABC transporter permease [Bryobacterales bacterium]|nr:ABC transporter permease [Bryobacteraceae bacterium]MDW8353809.1 ABC transporter permease [Bryobacterales bacterium]
MSCLRTLFLAPAALVMVVLILAPLGVVVCYSFLTRGAYGGVEWLATLDNYRRLLDPLYLEIFLRSVAVAGTTTALCLILAFPLAWFLSRAGRRKHLYLQLVLLPFWTSFLVRLYAWMFLLRDTGLINTILLAAGWIREPLPLLYNHVAVVLGLVYGYLPFAVLPLYATLERLDRTLLEAAADLGARPLGTLRHVILPLAAPGIRAAALLVFIPCLGTYLVPDLLGGSKTILVGTLIQNQFTTARDWPFGAAVSLTLMVFTVVAVLIWLRRGGDKLL